MCKTLLTGFLPFRASSILHCFLACIVSNKSTVICNFVPLFVVWFPLLTTLKFSLYYLENDFIFLIFSNFIVMWLTVIFFLNVCYAWDSLTCKIWFSSSLKKNCHYFFKFFSILLASLNTYMLDHLIWFHRPLGFLFSVSVFSFCLLCASFLDGLFYLLLGFPWWLRQ